jgi:hypothetical protein
MGDRMNFQDGKRNENEKDFDEIEDGNRKNKKGCSRCTVSAIATPFKTIGRDYIIIYCI